MKKVGRNDPCPCGSGKKYKKCCLNKDQSNRVSQLVQRERTSVEPGDSLRRKIVRFMEREEFKKYVIPAVRLYWKTLEEGLEPEPMSDTEVLSFNEWFIHDYILPDHGKPLITVFLERNPELQKEELQILKDWQETYISVYQITRVEVGQGVYGEDIFSGEEFFLHDVSSSKGMKKWELLVTRKVWVLNEWQLSAAGIRFFPIDKKDIYDFVMTEYRKYKKEHPTAKIPDFLHLKGYLLNHYYQTRKVKPRGLPKVVIPEGEELVFHEAIFDVLDFDKVIQKLEKTSDYEITSEEEDEKGEVVHCTFDWLQKGGSADLFKEKPGKNGMSLHSFWMNESGEEKYRTLGNIDVSEGRLKLSVLSEERLRVGKDLLRKTLGKAIKHRMDSIQTLESKMEEGKGKTKKEQEPIDPEIERVLLKGMMDKHYKEWLDSKIPALGNKTPRESVKTKSGRKKVEDLLRTIEYSEQGKKESGQFVYDFYWMRKELGMESG